MVAGRVLRDPLAAQRGRPWEGATQEGRTKDRWASAEARTSRPPSSKSCTIEVRESQRQWPDSSNPPSGKTAGAVQFPSFAAHYEDENWFSIFSDRFQLAFESKKDSLRPEELIGLKRESEGRLREATAPYLPTEPPACLFCESLLSAAPKG